MVRWRDGELLSWYVMGLRYCYHRDGGMVRGELVRWCVMGIQMLRWWDVEMVRW